MSAKAELREFLKNAGRDVGRHVGDHLAGMAQDRAVAFVQDLVGEGLQEELGAAASSVGRAGLSSALTQLGVSGECPPRKGSRDPSGRLRRTRAPHSSRNSPSGTSEGVAQQSKA